MSRATTSGLLVSLVSLVSCVVATAAVTAASGCSSDESVAATHPPASTPDGGGEGGGKDAGPDAAACLGEDGTQADCGGVPNGCGDVCNGLAQAYRSGVARAIVTCIAALTTCDDRAAVRACIDKAIARACDDPGAALYCQPLVADCAKDGGFDAGVLPLDAGDGGDAGDGDGGDGGATTSATRFDEATCESLMKGLSSDGRQTFASCITDGKPGQCTADPGACVDQIKQ